MNVMRVYQWSDQISKYHVIIYVDAITWVSVYPSQYHSQVLYHPDHILLISRSKSSFYIANLHHKYTYKQHVYLHRSSSATLPPVAPLHYWLNQITWLKYMLFPHADHRGSIISQPVKINNKHMYMYICSSNLPSNSYCNESGGSTG